MALYRHYHLSYPGYSYPVARQGDEVVHRALPPGSVRLRRWLESREEQRRVTVEREILVVRRQPVFEPIEGVELGAQRAELTLMDDEPVVTTRIVARERVTIQASQELVPDQPDLVGVVPGPPERNGKGAHHDDRQTP
jgi:hypothetical protein